MATPKFSAALRDAAKAGHELNDAQLALAASTQAAQEEASGYELALAGMAGQMGGATGQAMNLVIAMREHNKAQDKAAIAGEKTEGKFSKLRMGAGLLGEAFSAIGDKIGGTAGKVLESNRKYSQSLCHGRPSGRHYRSSRRGREVPFGIGSLVVHPRQNWLAGKPRTSFGRGS